MCGFTRLAQDTDFSQQSPKTSKPKGQGIQVQTPIDVIAEMTTLLNKGKYAELSRKLNISLLLKPGDAGLLDIKKRLVISDYKNTFVEPVNVFAGTRFEVMPVNGKCNPGVLNTFARERVLKHLIYFRRLAGINDSCVFLTASDKECQSAAFMMDVNNKLSHAPTRSWKCFNDAGAKAASCSNLSLGYGFEAALLGQLMDDGENNAATGHRRWILNPDNSFFGFGSTNNAMCLKVFGSAQMGGNLNRQISDSQYVAWPSADFFPQELLPERWSFSLKYADFSKAKVQMGVNGKTIKLKTEKLFPGYALNTLVWVPEIRPVAGAVCKVVISGVKTGNKVRSYTYSITVLNTD